MKPLNAAQEKAANEKIFLKKILITLKKTVEFKMVYERGTSVANKNLALYLLKNNSDCFRFGFSISKKVGKAVLRNKIRRRLKEIIRRKLIGEGILRKLFFSSEFGFDIIVIARKSIANSEYKEIEMGFVSLLEKCANKDMKKHKGIDT